MTGPSTHHRKRGSTPASPSPEGAPGGGPWPAAIFGAIDDRQFDLLRQAPIAAPEGLAEEMRDLAIAWYGALFMTDPRRFTRSLGHFPSHCQPDWYLVQLTQPAPGHRQPFRYVAALPAEVYSAYGVSPFAVARRGLFRFAAEFAADPSRGECPGASLDGPPPADPLPHPRPDASELVRLRSALDMVLQGQSVAFTGTAPQEERDRLFELLFWLMPAPLRRRYALSTFSFSRRVQIDERAPLIACYCDNRSIEPLFPEQGVGMASAAVEDLIRSRTELLETLSAEGEAGMAEGGRAARDAACGKDAWVFGDASVASGDGDGARETIAPVVPSGEADGSGPTAPAGQDPLAARLEAVEQAMRKMRVLQSDVTDLQECVARLSTAYRANGAGEPAGAGGAEAWEAPSAEGEGARAGRGDGAVRRPGRRALALVAVAVAAFLAGLATEQILAATGTSTAQLARQCWQWLAGLGGG